MIKRRSIGLLLIATMMLLSVSAVNAASWDRADATFTGGSGVSADIWNSCSDGSNGYYPSGHCSSTEAARKAKLEITVTVRAEAPFGNTTYYVGPVNDVYLAEDGAGVKTYYIRSTHYVNDVSRTILSSIE